MSTFISPYDLGKNFEAYFVCPEGCREYFEKVCQTLECEHAAKSGVFCYNKDDFSEITKKHLKRSKNVVFVLTQGAVEKAAAEDYDEFRKAYRFVWENNPHSLSLIAINDCHLGYGIEYPEDMQSFKWLHRKKYILSDITEEDMAHELCTEFRLGYTQAKSRKLDRLAECGGALYSDMYFKGKRCLTMALVCQVIAGILAVLLFCTDLINSEVMWLYVISTLVSLALPVISIGYLCFAFMHSIYQRIIIFDVSVLFADFKRRTVQRLSVIFGILIGIGSVQVIGKLLEISSSAGDKAFSAFLISIYAVSILFTAVQLAKVCLLDNLCGNIVEVSEKRGKIHLIFTVIHASLAVLTVIAILINLPKL